MCHVILALPVLTIPVFWLLPLNVALPVYITVALLSLALYREIRKSMIQPVKTGLEGLVGRTVEILSGRSEKGIYTVKVQGELWKARSSEKLKRGDTAVIKSVDGMRLFIASAIVERPVRGDKQ